MYLLPPELLTLIFENCDSLSQACALSRTSSYAFRVWAQCRTRLGWRLAGKEVVGFDDAVMTASCMAVIMEAMLMLTLDTCITVETQSPGR